MNRTSGPTVGYLQLFQKITEYSLLLVAYTQRGEQANRKYPVLINPLFARPVELLTSDNAATRFFTLSIKHLVLWTTPEFFEPY